ncbi:MAG: extracellular solute-binding protein [Nocardioides sp.]
MDTRGRSASVIATLAVLLAAGCGSDDALSSSDTMTLYTCASDTTIQPIIEKFESDSGTQVDLFRAPTGELNARVAGDVRSGGLQADVVWACDPLTMQGYVDQGLVGGFVPEDVSAIPEEFRTEEYVGAAVLYMLVVHGEDVPAPTSWSDLTGEEYADGVAVPDPALAASALGALGYFSQDPGYGLDFYQALSDNGATQVSTPDDVTVGVAEGVYKAGITIEKSAFVAEQDGSPIGVVAPEPGAIAIYGPIALATDSADSTSAQDFINLVLSEEGQTIIADSGASPASADVPSQVLPEGTKTISPDWTSLGAQTDDLLADYQKIFGG